MRASIVATAVSRASIWFDPHEAELHELNTSTPQAFVALVSDHPVRVESRLNASPNPRMASRS